MGYQPRTPTSSSLRRRRLEPRYVLAEHPDAGYRKAGQALEVRRMACERANELFGLARLIMQTRYLLAMGGGALGGHGITVSLLSGALGMAALSTVAVVMLLFATLMLQRIGTAAVSTCARLAVDYGLVLSLDFSDRPALTSDPSIWTPPSAPSTNVRPSSHLSSPARPREPR